MTCPLLDTSAAATQKISSANFATVADLPFATGIVTGIETGSPKSLDRIATDQDETVGGKAYNLAVLKSHGFPVPDGLSLARWPNDVTEWNFVSSWWDSQDRCPLAVRSSARGEDSTEASFAGQLTSIVGVRTESDLRAALSTCFASGDRAASQSYQEHFGHRLKGMNVLVQRMVEPRFSGVFFSRDPRRPEGARTNDLRLQTTQSWIVEGVEGFGEQLVSGAVTPFRFTASGETSSRPAPSDWTPEDLTRVVQMGLEAQNVFQYPVDVEWAIDRDGRLWMLQARAITTNGTAIKAEHSDLVQLELARLIKTNGPHTTWDSQTFVEWTGVPSKLSLSVWQRAFAPRGAFVQALREVGYAGSDPSFQGDSSLLEEVFGRACLNLTRLEPLFFGKVPYRFISKPHPHLEFDWRKIDLPTILHAPSAIARMTKVAWTLQNQDSLRETCEAKLRAFSVSRESRESTLPVAGASVSALVKDLSLEAEQFATEALLWPFILAITVEAHMETLELVLAKDLGRDPARLLLSQWMSRDLHTVTSEMESAHRDANFHPERRPAFFEAFGHRGPGELDLARERWSELSDRAFTKENHVETSNRLATTVSESLRFEADVEERVHAIRRPYVRSAWTSLKALLELRERWKMEIMKSYARLRRLALEIGRSTGLGEDVFALDLQELEGFAKETSAVDPTTMTENSSRLEALRSAIREARERREAFRQVRLPVSFTLADLQSSIDGTATPVESLESPLVLGESLSPGVAHGEVRVVRDPKDFELSATWPENVVLVAEATDPGWTPLFRRARAVVVERGGVLSHCAIVAREMGLPAVSQITNATTMMKDGDHVWVDGNHGSIRITRSH